MANSCSVRCRCGRSLCRCSKLRRNISVKHRGADMIETALEISPDLTAHIGPAFAEGEVLAEIGPACVVDHAIEQCKPIGTSRERIDGMFTKKLQGCVSGMFAHFFQDMTPDHQETGAGVAHPRESVHGNHMIR